MARITFRVNQEPPLGAEDVTYYAFRPGYGQQYIHPHNRYVAAYACIGTVAENPSGRPPKMA